MREQWVLRKMPALSTAALKGAKSVAEKQKLVKMIFEYDQKHKK